MITRVLLLKLKEAALLAGYRLLADVIYPVPAPDHGAGLATDARSAWRSRPGRHRNTRVL